MAALRGGLFALISLRKSTAMLPSSFSSSSLIFSLRCDTHERNCTNAHSASMDARIQRCAQTSRPADLVGNFVDRERHRFTRKHNSHKVKVSEKYAVHVIQSKASLARNRMVKWDEGRAESLCGRNLCFITADGTMNIPRDSNCGQTPGILQRDPEDASADCSIPSGSCQSADDQENPAFQRSGSAHSEATISEVDVGIMEELKDALGFPLGQQPQAPVPGPLVIVVSGPSGVGKDAVIRKLQQTRRDIHFVVTATTRLRRPNEVDGVDYHFMSKTEFQEMIDNHELLEHAMVYGDYKGIPKQQVREVMSQGRDVVLRVDVQGAATVRSILGSDAVFIFLVAESEQSLVKRLIERKTETMDKMLVRVATAREELTRMDEFDYVVVNQEGCLDKTVAMICSIIDAEKAKVKPKIAEI